MSDCLNMLYLCLCHGYDWFVVNLAEPDSVQLISSERNCRNTDIWSYQKCLFSNVQSRPEMQILQEVPPLCGGARITFQFTQSDVTQRSLFTSTIWTLSIV